VATRIKGKDVNPALMKVLRELGHECPSRPNKYRNKPVRDEMTGKWFPSQKEYGRWRVLRIREIAGEVRHLKTQVAFLLVVNGVTVATYRADFVYEELQGTKGKKSSSWRRVVEDTKGVRTELYKLKRLLMKALYGIEILET
jgi:hypothetical protein